MKPLTLDCKQQSSQLIQTRAQWRVWRGNTQTRVASLVSQTVAASDWPRYIKMQYNWQRDWCLDPSEKRIILIRHWDLGCWPSGSRSGPGASDWSGVLNTVILLAVNGDPIRHLPAAMTWPQPWIHTPHTKIKMTDKKIYFPLTLDRLDPFIDIFTNH